MTTAIHNALLNTINDRTSPEAVSVLIRAFQAAQVFDPLTPCGSQETPFLWSWIQHGSFLPSPEILLEMMEASPGLLALKPPRGQILLMTALAEAQRSRGSKWDTMLATLLEHTPADRLKNVALTHYGEHQSLLSFCFQDDYPKSLEVLVLKKGFKIDSPALAGRYARLIRTETLWNCFLSQGGDPLQKDSEGKALWESIFDATRDRQHTQEFSTLVKKWVTEHRSTAVSDYDMKEYWAKVGRYEGHTHFKSRADWPMLQNPEGKTPMMLLMETNGGNIKHFCDVKKVQPGLNLQDHQGKNLWAYALAKGKLVPRAALQWMVQQKIPLVADHQGRGVLGQVLLNFSNQHEILDPAEMQRLAPYINQNPVAFWGAADQQQEIVQWLQTELYWKGAGYTRVAQCILGLAERTPMETLRQWSPELLGWTAFFAAMQTSLSPDPISTLTSFLEAGAQMSPAVLEEVILKIEKDARGQYSYQQSIGRARATPMSDETKKRFAILQSGFEKNMLHATEATPGPTRKSMRL